MARLAGQSLGYCTNVHPGESLQEVFSSLRGPAARVRELWQRRDSALGLGLWLSAQATRELLQPGQIGRLKELCSEAGLAIPSINGFPIGGFHDARVKENVYRPDWMDSARSVYTSDLIRAASLLAPPGQEVSISTLPISYRAWVRDPEQLRQVARHLALAAQELDRAEQETGVAVHLALEPEPDCVLETSLDVIRFFRETLLPLAGPELRRLEGGLSEARAVDLLQDKIRVCYDTCHAALVFESPRDVLEGYAAHGIRVGKVQISSALRVSCEDGHTSEGASIIELLEPFSHDRYLHQVVGRSARYSDLPQALNAWREHPPTGEFRVHCHVPIFMESYGRGLLTTQDHIVELLELAETKPITPHWEVETYTWEVLPAKLREGELSTRIARELNWI